MKIEVERKAEISSLDLDEIFLKLYARTENAYSVEYIDTYLDNKHLNLAIDEQELRIRTINDEINSQKYLLTYKTKPIDTESKSKKEVELEIESAEAMLEIFLSMGFAIKAQFTKECVNFPFLYKGYSILATVVEFTDKSEIFLEIETQIETYENFELAMHIIGDIYKQLGIDSTHFTNEYYTDFM